MNEKDGDIVRVEFTIDFDLTEKQKDELIENPLGFLYNHIDIKEIDNDNYNVVKVACRDIMPYRAYGFPNQVVDRLNKIGIYRIEKICKYTYRQIKQTQVKEITDSFHLYHDSDFIPMLIDVMRERNLNFADISIDDLIPIRNLNISAHITNALIKRGINYFQDIPLFTQAEIEKTNGLGVKYKKELEEALKERGIQYKKDDNYNEILDVHLDISTDKVDYCIDNKLYYGDYGLSDNLIDWLNVLEVYSFDLLENLSYRDFRLSRDEKNKNSFKYISEIDMHNLINKMKEKNINFKDLKAKELLPISDCGFSVRPENCLVRFGIVYLQDIALFSKGEVSRIRNLSKTCLNEIDRTLDKYGMRYRDE